MRRTIAAFRGARQLCLATLVILSVSAIGNEIRLEKVGSGFERPVDLVWAPGAPNEWYVVEQPGRILRQSPGKKASVWLDIRSKVAYGGEMGLLSLAFHPQYAKNHRFYLNYTVDEPKRATRVVERHEGSDREKLVIGFDQPYSNHNGGHLLFGPDNYLYIATGDGGAAGDPKNRAQSLATLLGKILRIDTDAAPPSAPKDNPFRGKGQRSEIFAYGMRNPWRMSFDPKTGKLWTGDVGQNRFEEIDIIEKGGNYGWKVREGLHCFSPKIGCNPTGFVEPVYEYGHEEGQSITGGHVYRGKKIPSLNGSYLYADFVSGKIWALDAETKPGTRRSNRLLLKSGLPIASFGVDPLGEIYVVAHDGDIYRVVAGEK